MKDTRRKLKEAWLKNKSQSVGKLIADLNPIVRGIANYLRRQVNSEAFAGLDHYMFQRERRYVNRMHPKKSKDWRKKRYWGKLNLDRDDRWVFGDKHSGTHLLKFGWFKHQKHVGIKFKASPDDPDMREYWEDRNKEKSTDYIPSYQKVAKKQDFKCPMCGQTLFNDEKLHIHHITPKRKGGNSKYSNLQLVHLYCHQQIHASIEKQKSGKLNDLLEPCAW